MSEDTFIIESKRILIAQSFHRVFAEIVNSLDPRVLAIEAVDGESLDLPRRFEAYHDVGVQGITGEENANIGKTLHPSHRHGKIYEGWEKLKSYDMLHRKMEGMFGAPIALQATRELLSGCFAVHDSPNIDLPYCVAYSSSHLMREGRSYIDDVPNIAPTNFKSYMNMATESMFDACAEFMGTITSI